MSFAASFREEAVDFAVRSGSPVATAFNDYANHLLAVHGTYERIGEVYHCSQPNVSMFMKRVGFSQNKRLTTEQKQVINQCHEEGVSVTLMRTYRILENVKANTIYQHLRRQRQK